MMCPDNYDRWLIHQARQDEEEDWVEANLPECEYCKEEGKRYPETLIRDEDFIHDEGYFYHEDCFMKRHRMYLDEYLSDLRGV